MLGTLAVIGAGALAFNAGMKARERHDQGENWFQITTGIASDWANTVKRVFSGGQNNNQDNNQ